tara:strand:+ start:22350 stop:22640 length:291 start_codon:yes stop_codon:yes gene_type:complete
MEKDEDEFYCGETKEAIKKINFTEEYRNLMKSIKMKKHNREDELLDALRIVRDDLDEIISSVEEVRSVFVGVLPRGIVNAIQTLEKVRNFANDASL